MIYIINNGESLHTRCAERETPANIYRVTVPQLKAPTKNSETKLHVNAHN